MTVNLNEYVLHHIASFLKPHDWVQMSQVCKLWKLATSKLWMTIKELEYLGFQRETEPGVKKATILSDVDTKKIVICAAPFVKILSSRSFEYRNHTRYFRVGQYYYGAKNLKLANILKLLAKKSTELTEIGFDFYSHMPQAHLVRPLFKNNKITKFRYSDCSQSKRGWHRSIATHDIVELNVKFLEVIPDFVSFHERFPNLKKLFLRIEHSAIDGLEEDPKQMLSQILPHVTGLKTLYLTIHSISCDESIVTNDSHMLFSEITKLSHLEELKLRLLNYHLESPGLFFNQLPKCCPKLRFLKLANDIQLDEVSIKKLLSLPHLEIFDCPDGSAAGFPRDELPEMQHLKELYLCLDGRHFDNFLKAVRKMPRLEKLCINDFNFDESELMRFVCGIVEVATSLGKDVLICTSYDYYKKNYSTKQLRVKKSSNHQSTETFEQHREILKFTFFDCEYDGNKLLEHVAAFVRNKLHCYDAFVFEDKE